MDIDTNHFRYGPEGEVIPQPWMQLRRVAVGAVPAKSGNYASSGGGNKNDLIQTLQVPWMNDTPMGALIYAEVTRGGTKVTLQARSQGGLVYQNGRSVVSGPITLTDASMLACSIDAGKGGSFGQNVALAVAEVRQPSITTPLCPDITGLVKLAPGATFTGRVDCRFITSIWEGTDPDSGAAGQDSTYSAGDLTIEIFALPDFD